MPTIEQRIQTLRDEIDHHSRLYYAEARPVISDREFDKLLQELIDLETVHPELVTPDSPTQRVGGDVQTELKSVRHAVPMMSIENTYSEAEVRSFDERVRKLLSADEKVKDATPAYVLEPKIDGTSISLRYENGMLVLAATRGRGNVGDDVTVNVRTIQSVPLKLRDGKGTPVPGIVEVRGEIYMDNEDFQRVNKELVDAGEEPYANARNTTAGTLRRLDPKVVAKRRLRFLAHGLGQVEPLPVKTYWEWVELLKHWGLPVPKEVKRVESIEEAMIAIAAFEKQRPTLPYMTDGMVMKVDDFAQRESLGETSKSPRWLIAYKYETEQQPTVLRKVDWQVGKSGVLTPVGRLDPVWIGGVVVGNVTLHNLEQIRKLDIRVGDTVILERAGEVIPHVRRVDFERRPPVAKAVDIPQKCPSCGSRTSTEDEVRVRCLNRDCPSQIKERLVWFCGRSQMNIKGLGDSLISQLVDEGRLKTFSDIYRLKHDQLSELKREGEFGEKKAKTLIESITQSSSQHADALSKIRGDAQMFSDLIAEVVALTKLLTPKPAGLGDKTVAALINQGVIRRPSDLFSLSLTDVSRLPMEARLGEKQAKTITAEVESSKDRGLACVLAGLGIRMIGDSTARKFAEWAGDIRVLREATIDDLAAVLATDAAKAETAKEKEEQKAVWLCERIRLSVSPFDSALPNSNTEEILADPEATKKLGKARISAISEAFPTFDDLRAASPTQILDCLIDGRAAAKSLYEFLHSRFGGEILEELSDLGVRLSESVAEVVQSKWSGKRVVITGNFGDHSRPEIEARLRELGATVQSSVSKKTDMVLAGEKPGSNKLEGAKEYSVPIFGPEEVEAIFRR